MATENERFPSKYLKAADVDEAPGGKLCYTISTVGFETFKNRDNGEEERKTVLELHETEKKFVVGKNNWKTIVSKTSLANDSDWSGVILHLGTHQTQMGLGILVMDAKIPEGTEPVGGSPPQAKSEESLPF